MICKACEFRTERLVVKEWHLMCEEALGSSDLTQIVQSLLTPKVTAHLPEHWRNDAYRSNTKSWISERDDEGAMLLVVKASTNAPVGILTLFESDRLPGAPLEIRLGYVLAESAWGQGLATELVTGFVDWTRTAGVCRIIAGVSMENSASVRVLEKCGFRPVGPEGNPGPGVGFYELAITDG